MIGKFLQTKPRIASSAFIAKGAVVVGDVTIGERSSVFFNCVLRADISFIKIGNNTNIQDLTMIHLDPNKPAIIGDNVSVGHQALIHGCEIGDGCLIGVKIGANCIVAAGSIITANKEFPPNSLIMGQPAKIIRALTGFAEIEANLARVERYAKLSAEHSQHIIVETCQ